MEENKNNPIEDHHSQLTFCNVKQTRLNEQEENTKAPVNPLENNPLNIDFNKIATNAKTKLDTVVKTTDSTNQFTKEDIEANRIKALLSYVFAPIPYLDKNSSPFTKYHACQGMNLFIVVVGYFLLRIILTTLIKEQQICAIASGNEIFCRMTPSWVLIPLNIIGLLLTALAVVGVCNVLLGKAVALPLVSKLNLFKIES